MQTGEHGPTATSPIRRCAVTAALAGVPRDDRPSRAAGVAGGAALQRPRRDIGQATGV